jgi:hypothetical protein
MEDADIAGMFKMEDIFDQYSNLFSNSLTKSLDQRKANNLIEQANVAKNPIMGDMASLLYKIGFEGADKKRDLYKLFNKLNVTVMSPLVDLFGGPRQDLEKFWEAAELQRVLYRVMYIGGRIKETEEKAVKKIVSALEDLENKDYIKGNMVKLSRLNLIDTEPVILSYVLVTFEGAEYLEGKDYAFLECQEPGML